MFFKRIFDGLETITISLIIVGMAGVILLGGLTYASAAPGYKIPVLIGSFFCGGALAIAWQILRIHFKRLTRLRGAVIVAISQSAGEITYAPGRRERDEVALLHAAIDELMRDRLTTRRHINTRLEGVLSAIADAVIVVTRSGLVSLVNGRAKHLLDADKVATGTSIYAAIHTSSWEQAVAKTQAHGEATDVSVRTLDERQLPGTMRELADNSGVVMSFTHSSAHGSVEIEHALDLHDLPPKPAVIAQQVALGDLPGLVLDCETTGLSIHDDVIISIGAVRTNGDRIYRSSVIDTLINPDRVIPKRSTAIHGITNEMVENARGFGEVWPEVSTLLKNVVLIGYNIPFDIAFLRRQTKQAGLAWQEPVFLDVMLLYAALEPGAHELSLDKVATSLGVQIEGRHTALGDALATAEVFTRLLPRLTAAGVTTLSDALAFQNRPKALVTAQKKAGWYDGLDNL